MINVKLIVFFFCVATVACSTNYCEICPNHTLCKYIMPGPSTTCQEYNETPITKGDINNIIHKINERRNFVASGLSRTLPQAANMNKIYWSAQLAATAQRWVDQCDGATNPDQEDQCRDLGDTKVGQNIASVAGPTPGLRLSSLIDVWFMQTLDYSGSVAYYNQSRDWKTNYFTQLIWAETDRVGCGRARFYVEQKNSIIERLVCNFAPRGNTDGRPVYAIGYPATQCRNGKLPDPTFTSLCAYYANSNVRESTTTKPTVSSLLMILNLSNNSVKYNSEIDTISNSNNNLKQVKFDANETNEQRSQKTRHVLFNNSRGLLKNMPTSLIQNQWMAPSNYSRRPRLQQHQQERGHSKVYHGHDLHGFNNNFESGYKETTNRNYPTYQSFSNRGDMPTNNNYRKFENTDEVWTPSPNANLRKNYRYHECTRKSGTQEYCMTTPNIMCNHCTRNHAAKNCYHSTQLCQTDTPCKVTNHNVCPCNTLMTFAPECKCHVNYQCPNIEYVSTQCPPYRRNQDNPNNDKARKSIDLHYYDLAPNLAIRSGDNENEKVTTKEFQSSVKDTWLQHDIPEDDIYKQYSPKMNNDQRQVLHDMLEHTVKNKHVYDYIYDSSNSRERKKRDSADEVTFKPFWQMDEFNHDKSTLLKSLKYTTLSYKKGNKNKRITSSARMSQTTESITVQLKDGAKKLNHKNHVTEKYLSFDELMHLRKLTTTEASALMQTIMNSDTTHDINANARRADTPKPAEYTTNTPFKRKKHCTRKLTCTWTAPTVVGQDGSVIVPGIGGDRGSRTPPGYVDGCTRTSTCTRDFMDRNKFATISDEMSTEMTVEDEDYCEKRALDVRKRDSGVDDESVSNNKYDSHPATPYTTYFTYTIENINVSSIVVINSTPSLPGDDKCVCDEQNTSINRNRRGTKECAVENNSRDYLSYGDLYYLIIQKIIKTWKNKQKKHFSTCLCNSTVLVRCSLSLTIFIFLYIAIITLFI